MCVSVDMFTEVKGQVLVSHSGMLGSNSSHLTCAASPLPTTPSRCPPPYNIIHQGQYHEH